MTVRHLAPGDVIAAGQVLFDAYDRLGRAHGYGAPWASAGDAAAFCAEALVADGEAGFVAEGEGVEGIAFIRRRGEVATVGPLAAAEWGRGIGGRLVDELIACAEGWGCQSIRLHQDAWNPVSFALFAGRSFTPVDVVASIERPSGKTPPGASRGLEVAPFQPGDVDEVAALDLRLTGHERRNDLLALVKLVARRRGALVAFLGRREGLLGPGVALDAADLGALLARSLEGADVLRARLSTAAPTAMLMARALGFRVTSVGTVMVRGLGPPARPPQLFSLAPEVL